LRTGTILLPGTSQLTETDIDSRLWKSNSDCIIVDQQMAEKIETISAKHKNLKFKIFVENKEPSEGMNKIG
jgi:medium-chain acyl-CoA synthetase